MTAGELAVLLAVAVLAGVTASLTGFGIGSLLTPLVALRTGMPVAVAAVAIPHAAATALRCWTLRTAIDAGVLRRFGTVSAAGALLGALLQAPLGAQRLTGVLGVLLLLTGAAAITGWNAQLHPRGAAALALGALSGLFGGLAGNQGGVRSAAMLSFSLEARAFVATATATGLLVDAARTPVYLSLHAGDVLLLWRPIGVMLLGVVAGTLLGERVLRRLPTTAFRRAIGTVILLIGASLLV
ncbi:MAG: TSUP family transporter [Gemmatimonadaceae bacterium]|nr:TSUP family transporter [Gemmatimonadaceae bacterium]